MIRYSRLVEAFYESMKTAATRMPGDVVEALRRIVATEESNLAREHIEISLENARLSAAGEGLVCGDTGYPLYFVRVGGKCILEGGISDVYAAAKEATRCATLEAYLRPTMVDPIVRSNPGDNIGPGMPRVKLSIAAERDDIVVVAAPKGGGSEIFGTFYRMLVPADGMPGIKKYIIESVHDACYAGKVCPPAIVGVGIGGSADLCMEMAKEEALLRPVGAPSPRPDIAALETELLAAANSLGVGPMGSEGTHAVMSFHIAHALTHTAALPVAVNAQCLIGRRWLAHIHADATYELTDDISLWHRTSGASHG